MDGPGSYRVLMHLASNVLTVGQRTCDHMGILLIGDTGLKLTQWCIANLMISTFGFETIT
jgi:hypothetical protein